MDYSYIYRITYKPTGEYYIGRQTDKRLKKTADEHFMIEYFTSSKEVLKRLVYTDINDWEWWTKSMPREEAMAEEKRLLNEAATDPLCLHKHILKMWQNPEYRERYLTNSKTIMVRKQISEKLKEYNRSPEVRKAASERTKALWANPEYRKKVTATHKRNMTPEKREHLSQKAKEQAERAKRNKM